MKFEHLLPILSLCFGVSTFAADPSVFKIAERRADGKINTYEISGTILTLNGQKTDLEKEAVDQYVKTLNENAALKSAKSDSTCLPNERTEFTIAGKTRTFCKNQKALEALNEMMSDLKVVSLPMSGD